MTRPRPAALLIPLLLLAAAPARGERFHARAGGTRAAGPSAAGDWDVANCYPDLRAALRAAAAPDTVLLWRETHALATAETLRAFLGNADLDGARDDCRVALAASGQLVAPAAAAAVAVRGLTFAGGGAARVTSALQLAAGGGVGRVVALADCAFGGFARGAGTGGAALHAAAAGAGARLEARGCLWRDCTAGGAGGAVRLDDGWTAALDSCRFAANTADAGGAQASGGALALVSVNIAARATLTACVFDSNRADGPGGALFAGDAGLTLRDCTVAGSVSAYTGATNWSAGAGVFVRRDGPHAEPLELVIERCTVRDNRANLAAGPGAGDGGGVMVRGADAVRSYAVRVTDSVFEGNFNDQGAGLYIGRFATGTVERCVFRDNVALTSGGGAYKGGATFANLGETAVFAYCLFQGNRAGYDAAGAPAPGGGTGGGCMTRRYPRVELLNCTFLDNLCGEAPGSLGDGFYNWSETQLFSDDRMRSRLVNCLFWGETGHDVQVRSDPYGLLEVSHCAWAPNQFACIGAYPVATIALDVSPLAAPGDPRLRADAPCVDAALPLGYARDCAGDPVPRGAGPDVGAFEFAWPAAAGPAPGAVERLVAWPNPAGRSVAFAVVAGPNGAPGAAGEPAPGTRFRIHDARGRVVAETGAAVWDGRDAGGRPVPAGIYFARRVDGGAAAARFTLVR